MTIAGADRNDARDDASAEEAAAAMREDVEGKRRRARNRGDCGGFLQARAFPVPDFHVVS